MRFQSFFAFPISLALLWSAAGPFSNAVPAPFPADTALRAPDLPRYIENAIPSTYTEDLNVTSVHLVRRGCFPSKEEEDDIGPTTCDGNVPPLEELRAQIQRWNKVPTRPSAFYTALGGAGGISKSKCWVRSHPDQIPPLPDNQVDPNDGEGNLGAVFFDNIVDPRYMQVVFPKMSASRQISFQKLLSQAMAMESVGTAWIFTKADQDLGALDDLPGGPNTWKNWEFPALTRNGKVDRIIRTDPNDVDSDPPVIQTIWTREQGPQGPEPLGLVEGL